MREATKFDGWKLRVDSPRQPGDCVVYFTDNCSMGVVQILFSAVQSTHNITVCPTEINGKLKNTGIIFKFYTCNSSLTTEQTLQMVKQSHGKLTVRGIVTIVNSCHRQTTLHFPSLNTKKYVICLKSNTCLCRLLIQAMTLCLLYLFVPLVTATCSPL
jgi:hypothetical protein